MKKFVFLAAFALGAATIQQAAACDWGFHATAAAPSVVVCGTSGCMTEPPAPAAQCSGTDCTAPQVAPKLADAPADLAPTSVAAACVGSGC